MRSYPNVRRPARLRLGVIIGFAIAVALALITGCGPAGQDSSIEERLGSAHAFPLPFVARFLFGFPPQRNILRLDPAAP